MIRFKDLTNPTIEQFFQTKTYYGLLEGIPNSKINRDMVKSDIPKGKRLFGINAVHLIPPVEKKEVFQSGKEMASLPSVTCFAELSHYKPMQDLEKERSVLCLIWYQDDFAFPIAETILAKIKDLSWGELSEDVYL
jgi:hypothetical protein